MFENGYVKLFRKMTEWEWYKDVNTKSLFLHLILCANHKQNKWQGIVINAGQLVTSLDSLSEQTGISKQSVRTSLSRLKSTHEITYQSTHHYTLITVENWASYQIDDGEPTQQSTQQLTFNQHTPNTRLTLNKNDKNDKKNILVQNDEWFSRFYALYPKKVGKVQAKKSWDKLDMTQTLFDEIMTKVGLFMRSDGWKQNNGQYIPMPATFLNNRRWEDEVIVSKKGGSLLDDIQVE